MMENYHQVVELASTLFSHIWVSGKIYLALKKYSTLLPKVNYAMDKRSIPFRIQFGPSTLFPVTPGSALITAGFGREREGLAIYWYLHLRQRVLTAVVPVHTHQEYITFKANNNRHDFRKGTKNYPSHESWKAIDLEKFAQWWNTHVLAHQSHIKKVADYFVTDNNGSLTKSVLFRYTEDVKQSTL
ncbi:hypothetical protein B0H14DRAFT_2599882 [Mycena olivaceomarginata]|nr:hypothetical protein B0H14DRAFT_2599882 [Mycena olivaceomarginata]